MTDIVLVHGIAQEQRSADDLETEWLPSLSGGLRNAGHAALADRIRRETDPAPDSISVRMAYYGSYFLTPDHQGIDPSDFDTAQLHLAEELALAWLSNATDSTRPKDAGEARRQYQALTADPTDAQGVRALAGRAVAALDRIPWFTRTGLAALALTSRTLAQVTQYLTDDTTRQHALAQVREHLTPTTRAVIGHSLGSVVAYEAVRELPSDQRLPLLITLGSPLGISAVNQRLLYPPAYPQSVQHWINLADRDDIVAARPNLLPMFQAGQPLDAHFGSTYTVDNGAQPHNAGFYLTKSSCGRALAAALR